MICDPPRWGLYPAQNLDGDIFSDISAALGGDMIRGLDSNDLQNLLYQSLAPEILRPEAQPA